MQRHLSLEAALDCTISDESTAEREEIVAIVAREFARLPQREKEAVEAYAGVSEDSCRTVARRRRVSTQTVCNWAKAGIAKLRPQLEGCL